jgi:hypothetical protein|uniref:hypothetical protein n=1 Tax=Altererythrobacter segetis TaxID=1104773 RepID=UPI00140AE425|nr:hypothetical protein [Altererythrobacter segetis]
MKHLFPALALFCLAACGAKDTDAGPGGVSIGEARALDEAAAMLEQQRLPPAAVASGTPAPKPPSPAPSATPSPPA